MRSTANNRRAGLDAVRIIGIIAIVAGHVWENEHLRSALYSWHVPLFFFISGYLWKPNRTLKDELARRTNTLVKPYVFWLTAITILFAAFKIYESYSFPSPAQLIAGGVDLGRPFSAFWFVTALFFTCLIFRAMERFHIGLSFAISIGGVLLSYYFSELISGIPLSAGVAVPALLFMHAGLILQKSENSFTHPILLGIVLTAAGMASVALKFASPLDMKSADFGTPIISIITAIAICTGLVLLGEGGSVLFPESIASATTSLASVGFMVVLTHSAVIHLLDPFQASEVVTFAVALIVPAIGFNIIKRTSCTGWATGIATKRPSESNRSDSRTY